VIEILDPISGELVARTVAPHVRTAGEFKAGGILVGFTETPEEALAFALYTISH
jgi:hypothetical protein